MMLKLVLLVLKVNNCQELKESVNSVLNGFLIVVNVLILLHVQPVMKNIMFHKKMLNVILV